MTKTTCEHSGIEWDTDFPMEPRLPHSTDGSYVVSAWVSINDKLPLPNEEVITYESDGFIRIAYFMDGSWFGADGREFKPGYWMPLPSPPREKA